MRNIHYTRRKYEKINPAAFRTNAQLLLYTVATNTIGEAVPVYTPTGDVMRVMFDQLGASSEEDMDDNKTQQYDVEKFIMISYLVPTWLNTKNRVRINDQDYQIIRAAESYSSNRFMRLDLMLIV